VVVNDEDRRMIYQVVAARRLQWDNLVWQVPILSLTAQAFLFTLALGPGTAPIARIAAAGLALLIALLSVALMARHRQAEIADAHWLEDYEQGLDPAFHVHGLSFRAARNSTRPASGWLGAIVPLWGGYKMWVIGLYIFGLLAMAIIVVTATAPQLLHSD
jgi:tetrahydromethanopterin S-methyltransferase subunit B